MAVLTPSYTFTRGVGIAGFLGLAIGVPFYAVTQDWLWWPFAAIIPVVVGGLTFREILSTGLKIKVPYRHEGLQTRLGEHATGDLLAPGTHFGLEGFENAIVVDQRVRHLNLAKEFTSLSADNQDLNVDGLFFFHSFDSSRTLNVENLDDSLMEEFETKIRLFSTAVKKPTEAVRLKDVLAEYMMLSPRPLEPPYGPTPRDHAEFKRKRLKPLCREGALVQNAADILMDARVAGSFRALACSWGQAITKVEIEDFNIPKAIKEAAASAAIAEREMAGLEVRNNKRVAMIERLKAAGVNPNTAANSVDMLMKLTVNKTVWELQDIELVAETFGPVVAGALAAIFKKAQAPKAKPKKRNS